MTKIHGFRSELRKVIDYWTENPTVDCLHVSGFCDSADRAELYCVFEREAITAMMLWRHS